MLISLGKNTCWAVFNVQTISICWGWTCLLTFTYIWSVKGTRNHEQSLSEIYSSTGESCSIKTSQARSGNEAPSVCVPDVGWGGFSFRDTNTNGRSKLNVTIIKKVKLSVKNSKTDRSGLYRNWKIFQIPHFTKRGRTAELCGEVQAAIVHGTFVVTNHRMVKHEQGGMSFLKVRKGSTQSAKIWKQHVLGKFPFHLTLFCFIWSSSFLSSLNIPLFISFFVSHSFVVFSIPFAHSFLYPVSEYVTNGSLSYRLLILCDLMRTE